MSRIITGITAHVDAGKTTLSEALLLASGAIRKAGRVDDGNAFLDTEKIEKRRGITIYAKEAILSDKVTLIDTPGHVDFTSEMERTLSVLDAAVLVISAPDGIQAHTRTLWQLLEAAGVPVLIFANKMDMTGSDKDALIKELKAGLSENICDFTAMNTEEIASSDDELTEKYLSGEDITDEDIKRVIRERKLFPLLFGSALRFQGTREVLEVLEKYFTPAPEDESFGAIVYRISRDRKGNRLTHMKITGGVLHARDELGGEKANEVRLFSGEKYESVREVHAGEVCTVTGLKESFPGCTYGCASIR
ncbi:MAG: GTP-binding protein, partial [Bullifex sp.]|nr:GTP-binding protein [Bullifex sp.]